MAKSEVKRAFLEDGARKTHIGGQALIEGVMMRGKTCWAAAVRKSDNSLHVERHNLSNNRAEGWCAWPLVRGCVALVDSLVIGYKALEIAANYAMDDTDYTNDENDECVNKDSADRTPENNTSQDIVIEGDASKDSAADDTANKKDAFGKGAMVLSMLMGVVLGLALFIFLPALVSNVLVGDYDTNTLAWNLIDGLARVAIFVFYVWLIGRMKDIKRMFAYHGAEHKTIHCYEHGLALTPEQARSFPRLHIRCGTAFLIMVMIIAILVYTIVPLDKVILGFGITDSVVKFLLVLLSRVILLPVIAGLSYEITVKWAGSHPDNALVKIILWPGMQMQRLTTNEPDDSQLECAIAAMKSVLDVEKAGTQ